MAAPAQARKSSPRKGTNRAAPRKASAPRKRAAARADGTAPSEDSAVPSPVQVETNGEAPQEPVKANSAVSFTTYDDPYPDEFPRFTFWPGPEAAKSIGKDPIIAPSFVTIKPTKHFIWKTRKDPMQQDNMWLDAAGIPDRIQERIVLLPDDEYKRFWAEWVSQELPDNDQVLSKPQPGMTNVIAGSEVPSGVPGE